MSRSMTAFACVLLLGGFVIGVQAPAMAQYYYPSYPNPYPYARGGGDPYDDAPDYYAPRARVAPARRQALPRAYEEPDYADDNDLYDDPQPRARPRIPVAPSTRAGVANPPAGAPMPLYDPGAHALPQPQPRTRVASLPPDADPAYSSLESHDDEVDTSQFTRRLVADPTGEQVGTITINTGERKLYLSLGSGRAVAYGIGVGRQGFAWKGRAQIGRKAFWPGWTPPSDMLKRRPDLPRHMDGGMDNPLGARALYLFQNNKDTLFRIHGTNEPDTIGHAVSSGCIRMLNADVMDLYQRVQKGTRVVVL